jgi:hypothetical protein
MASLTASGVTNSSGRLILNGAVTNPCSVLQVVAGDYSSVFQQQPGAIVTYDMPGILGDGSFNITPSSTTSKILFQWTAQIGHEDTWRSNHITTYYKIGAGGSWTQFFGGGGSMTYISGNNTGCRTCGNQFLLSLNTTSTVYFKLQIYGHEGESGYIHLNQNNNTNTTSDSNANGVTSTIMAMELA